MSMKSFFSTTKTWVTRPLFVQVLVVFLAFALMVFLAYLFGSDDEQKRLIHDVDSAIYNTHTDIVSSLREPETLLKIISEHIRHMILEGDDSDLVLEYLKNIFESMAADERLRLYVNAVYGSFDVFDGAFLVGIDWVPPDDYVPADRPWYQAAVEANGRVGTAQPYIDVRLGVVIVSFARCIFDDEGRQWGVVCLDVSLDMINENAVDTYVTKGSYGILMDSNFQVLAHPDPFYIGSTIRDMNDGLAIENELRQKKEITERRTVDYRGDASILFIRQLDNGWYMAIMAYAKDYYQSVAEIAHILSILGVILAGILSAILVKINLDKQKSDERTKIMFDAMPLCANFWNKNLENIDCNQESVRMFGMSSKQEYNSRFNELSPKYQPSGRLSGEMALEYVNKAFEEGYCRFEWMHQQLNGDPMPSEITLVRVEYRGEYIVTGYTRDLREQKALLNEIHDRTEELKKLAHWYENILDTIPLPLSVTDADMNWTFINRATENYLEIKRDDFMGLPCDNWHADICHTERCGIDRLKRGIKQTHFKQKGLSFQVDGNILKDLDGETIGYVEVVQDITQMEQTTKKQAEAESANRAKSAFLARVSHEIRTPMNAILGITEIELQNESLPPGTQESFDKIYHSGYLLLGIINDILDLSKIEAGKLELTPVQYDVPSLINDTVQLNTARYDSKPINFKLKVDENLPSTLLGDELRIKQILNNLLSNAFKYTDEGEVFLQVTVEKPENREKKNGIILVFQVSDTGHGMSEEQVEKLFDEYTRFVTEANRTTMGTGLGMAITGHLVQTMNGDISVESEPGKGSLFTVRLPQGLTGSGVLGRELAENLEGFRPGRLSRMKKAPQIVREYMPYGKVLVVDDVETNLYVARGLLSPYGLLIETASSGIDAVDKIKNGSSFDVIFMDHFMPKMDGMEATKIIRSLGYDRPIIALTANALAGQADIFLENGFDGFISKPIDIRQLNASLNKLIRDKYPSDVVEAARRQRDNQKKQTPVDMSQTQLSPELKGIFVRDAEKAAAVLESVYEKQNSGGDLQTYIINVHAMKSALANIGKTELSGMALKLEEAGREGNTAAIKDETPAFLSALRDVIGELKPEEKNTDNEITDADKDLPYLREKLTLIKTACASYDKKTAKDALAELRQKTWPRSTGQALDVIAEHLLHSEFEEAASVAEAQL